MVWPNGPQAIANGHCTGPLVSRGHDDRYHQHLHEPVTGMDRGHLPWDVFPEDRSREQDHREADPQEEAEVDRAHPTADAEEGHEARDHVSEDEAPPELDEQLPRGHLRTG